MKKNIILKSLKESFNLIWKNKSLFLLLLALQVIFFVFLFFVSQAYLTKVLESARAASDYIGQLRLDDVSLTQNVLQQKNILGDDPLSISRNFSEMVKNFRAYLIYFFSLLVVFLSVSWALAHKLVHKPNSRQSIKYFSRIFRKVFGVTPSEYTRTLHKSAIIQEN